MSTAVGFLPPLSNYDRYCTLGEIRGHTIVVSRGADILTPPAHSRDLAAGIPGAVHVHLPNAAHTAAGGVLRHPDLARISVHVGDESAQVAACAPAVATTCRLPSICNAW